MNPIELNLIVGSVTAGESDSHGPTYRATFKFLLAVVLGQASLAEIHFEPNARPRSLT